MSFVILRTAKLKTAGEIGGSLGHTFRIMDTPNADESLTHLNEHECSLEQVKQNIENRLPENIRKNGVRVVEYLITASPQWVGWGTEAETEFFDNAKRWLQEKHGSENVVGLSIHRDETSPHLVAYVVPIDTEGKLNARYFLGGRQKLSEMQTDFASRVGHIGLERGIEGSKAKHTKIKEYYSEIQKPLKQFKEIEISRIETQPDSHFLDSKKVHGQRVIDAVYDHISVQFDEYEKQKRAEFSALELKLRNEKNKNKRLEEQCKFLTDSFNTLKEIVENMHQEFEPFQDLRSKSESKYQDLKQTAVNEHERILQKEIDDEKELNDILKNIINEKARQFTNANANANEDLGPQVRKVQNENEKKRENRDNDFSM